MTCSYRCIYEIHLFMTFVFDVFFFLFLFPTWICSTNIFMIWCSVTTAVRCKQIKMMKRTISMTKLESVEEKKKERFLVVLDLFGHLPVESRTWAQCQEMHNPWTVMVSAFHLVAVSFVMLLLLVDPSLEHLSIPVWKTNYFFFRIIFRIFSMINQHSLDQAKGKKNELKQLWLTW